MTHIEDTSTDHPLRTITLRFDRSITPPAFETEALSLYQELHDRTYADKQRVQTARKTVAFFELEIEKVEELFDDAKYKFDHLKVMSPNNPLLDTVHKQLKIKLSMIEEVLESFVPELVNATSAYFEYDEHSFEQDQWRNEVAFPAFDQVFAHYQSCSIDMVFFDRDLDDYKGSLSFFKRQESKYYDTMNDLIERYSDINTEIDNFFSQIKDFDPDLL